jgi:hypothetical protein
VQLIENILIYILTCGQKQTSKIYPELKRHMHIHNPTDKQKQKCYDNSIDFNDITEYFQKILQKSFLFIALVIFTLSLSTKHFRNTNQLFAVKEMNLPTKIEVDQWRISRPKRGSLGGVSAAIFTPEAARKVVDQAILMLKNPPESDHPMNMWQIENLTQINKKSANIKLKKKICYQKQFYQTIHIG